MIELATGRYATFQPSMGVPVGVTVGRPKFPLDYVIAAEIDELKPFRLFHIEDDAEFERRFTARLDRIGVDRLAERFEQIAAEDGEPLVLLCYEKAGDQSCHRRTFARWWQARTGQEVPEAKRGGAVMLDGFGDGDTVTRGRR